jgi:hypothetical protein
VGIDVGKTIAGVGAGRVMHDELQAILSGRSFGERMTLWRAVMDRWDDLSGTHQRLFEELAANVLDRCPR